MKNIVVLSGGGMKCSYQVGAIKALKDKGISIDAIMGTSGGALNAAMIAQNKLEDLEFIWENIAYRGLEYIFSSTLVDLRTLKLNWTNLIVKLIPNINPFRKERLSLRNQLQRNLQNINNLATSTKLVKLLLTYIDKNKFVIPYKFNFTQLNTGQEVVLSPEDFDKSEMLAIGIAASASIPVLLNPLDVHTRNGIYYNCVDVGVSSNMLLSEAIKFIKTQDEPTDWRVIIINANANTIDYKPIRGVTNIISRTFIDIMLTNISLKELKLVGTYNKLTRNFVNIDKETYYNIPVVNIQPKVSLGGTLDINRELYIKSKEQGYKDTIKFFQ